MATHPSTAFPQYTAKGDHTCQKRAASCGHEAVDAKQWAEWGVDYVKDDSCSKCGSKTDNELYAGMWQAIQASGRPMVLTVEGNPDDALCSAGGLGNAKRVGHDISPHWSSMTSLVDIGRDLWQYAHNSTNATYGGWWNDLDMIEVGNGPDFKCEESAAALERCRAHFTMWTIMKAPLILGNDIPHESTATFGVISNKEAIAVNQDSLGVQARRVSATSATGATGATGSTGATGATEQLEVWVGALSGGRFAVALFNRSPSSAQMTLDWAALNATATTLFAVRKKRKEENGRERKRTEENKKCAQVERPNRSCLNMHSLSSFAGAGHLAGQRHGHDGGRVLYDGAIPGDRLPHIDPGLRVRWVCMWVAGRVDYHW